MDPHTNAAVLRAIYTDLSRIGEFVDDDVVLHPADRELVGHDPVVGRPAVEAHERDLIDATAGQLVMDVEHVVADDHFGAVLGVLRVSRGDGDIAMPFCGLWRFRDGRILEHWENAYDPAGLRAQLAPTDA